MNLAQSEITEEKDRLQLAAEDVCAFEVPMNDLLTVETRDQRRYHGSDKVTRRRSRGILISGKMTYKSSDTDCMPSDQLIM